MVRDKVLASSVVLRGAPTADERPVRELGQRLFEALVANDVRSLYVASRQRAHEQGSVLRLVLRVRPPELARLPWEFLFDPSQQDYLGLSMPLVRYPEVLAPRQPLQVALPLQILGMVARPGDQHALEVGEEQRRLHTALAGLNREGLVELSWVAGQTYNALQDALDHGPWHVFHFVGHEGYNRGTEEGTLALADDTGRTRRVGADDLSRLLAEYHTLRLVVLNACDTGRGSALDAFSSTAGALVRRWIPAVWRCSSRSPIPPRSCSPRHSTRAWPNGGRWTTASCAPAAHCGWTTTTPWSGARRCCICARPKGASSTAPALPPPQPPPQDPISVREVEALYDQALAAFWTERWDQAVVLLQQVLVHHPQHHPDVAVKLEESRHQQQLATHYAQACAAAEALDWDEAVTMFTRVIEVDPAYRDVGQRLDNARRRQQIACWQAEARRLHRAEQWAAVVKIGERLHPWTQLPRTPTGW